MSTDFPYEKYKDSILWEVINAAIADLVTNKDIVLCTSEDYIIGYLVKEVQRQLASTSEDADDQAQ